MLTLSMLSWKTLKGKESLIGLCYLCFMRPSQAFLGLPCNTDTNFLEVFSECSFSLLPDGLGAPRTAFPHSLYMVAGTQVSKL